MGMSASASLFYGIVVDEEFFKKALRGYNYIGEDDDDDVEEICASINLGFKISYCVYGGEYDMESKFKVEVFDKYCIGCESWKPSKGFSIPSQEELDAKWAEIKPALDKFGLNNKPKWHMFCEYS